MSITIDENAKEFFELCREIILGNSSLTDSVSLNEREIIIANFLNLKEEYINKIIHSRTSYTLEFDYDKGKKIIWDLLFLREYVLKYCDDNYRQAIIEEVKGKAKTDSTYATQFPSVDVKIVSSDALSSDQESIIKEAIVIFQKIRDCFSHQNIPIDNNECFSINSTYKDNCLVCDIPVKYLRDFGSHIIPLSEHKDLNSIVSHSISNLELELREVSIEYCLHPSILKRLLESSNNEEWKELPISIINCSEKRLNYLLDKVNNNIEYLKLLPSFIFHISSEKIEMFLKYISNDIMEMANYNRSIFSMSEERLLKILELIDNDVSKLNEVNEFFFNCSNNVLEFFLELVQNDAQKLLNLPKNILRLNTNRIKHLYYEKGLTIDEIIDLHPGFVNCTLYDFEMYLRLVDGDTSRLNELSYFVFSKEFSEEEIVEVLQTLGDKKEIFLNSLMESPYYTTKEGVYYWINYLNTHNVPIEDIALLPSIAFSGNSEVLNYLLSVVDDDVTKLLVLPKAVYTSTKEKLSFLLSLVDNQLERLNEFVLDYESFTEQKIIFSTNCDNQKIAYLYDLCGNDSSVLKKLPIVVFSNKCSIERLREIIDYIYDNHQKFDISMLSNITMHAFTCTDKRFLELMVRCGDIESLNDASIFLFNEMIPIEVIDRLLIYLRNEEGVYDFAPLKYVSLHILSCSEERLELILQLVNYDISQLTKIPKELYTCKDDTMFEYLYTQYSDNMIKSIFGISEEKVIALMLYMGEFFRSFPDNVATYDSFSLANRDLSRMQITNPTSKMLDQHTSICTDISQSTFLKKNNVTGVSEYAFDSIESLPDNKIRRCLEVQNKELYRVLRNCSEHLRIYPIDSATVKLVDGQFEAVFDVAVLYELIEDFKNRIMGSSTKIEWDNELAHRLALLNGHNSASQELDAVRLYASQVDEYIDALSDKTRTVKVRNLFVNSSPKTYGRICQNNQPYYLTTVVYSKIDYLEQQGYEVMEMSLDNESIVVTVVKDGITIREKLSVLVPPGVASSLEQSPIIQNLKYK